MLSVKRIRNRNYHIDLAREDYYLEGGEPPGQWYGSGAKSLGLNGQVEKAALLHIMDGFSADGSKKLVQNAGSEQIVSTNKAGETQVRAREIGWDFTLSAPKTLSVIWSQAEPRTRNAIQTIHEKAVKKTLDWLEAQARTRRGKGGTRQEPVQLVSALFEHGTSRELDPQLHTHCLLMNVGVRQDGTTGAIQLDRLLKHKMLLGALYRAELAKQLSAQLGYEIGPHLKGKAALFDFKGIDPGLVEAFSTRRHEIEDRLRNRGEAGAIAASIAALDTRQVKDNIPPRDRLFAIWQEIGESFDYTPPPPRFVRYDIDAMKQKASNEALEALVKQHDRFTQHDLLRAVAERAPQHGLGIREIEAAVEERLARNDIVHSGKVRGETIYTTQTRLALEKLLTAAVGEARKEVAQIAGLNAGKVTRSTLKKAKDALSSQGYQVVGIAPGKTALHLRDELGIKTYTPQRYLGKLHDQHLKLNDSTVLAIEGAEKMPTPLLARLVSEKKDAKLILLEANEETGALTKPLNHNPDIARSRERISGGESRGEPLEL